MFPLVLALQQHAAHLNTARSCKRGIIQDFCMACLSGNSHAAHIPTEWAVPAIQEGMRGCREQPFLQKENRMLMRDPIPTALTRGSALLSEDALTPEPLKTFHHTFDIYLKDSNAFMNTYFSRYFEWQGVCRERWFHECIHNDLLGSDGMFVTKRAHQEYVHETFPFQHVDCYLNTVQVKQCSAYLLFRFCVDGREVSKGYQQILYAGRDRKIRRFPEGIVERVKEYELPLTALSA